jgi:hypothetical protein
MNVTTIDMIAYDLFAIDPNDLLQLIQPHRSDLRVVDQLINTRHMWSKTLNELTTNRMELENILFQVNNYIASVYNQYSERASENRPIYMMRPFRSYEFKNFLMSGKTRYQDAIKRVDQYTEQLTRDQYERGIKQYPLDNKLIPRGAYTVDAVTRDILEAIDDASIAKVPQRSISDAMRLFYKQKLLPPVIVDCESGKITGYTNIEYLIASNSFKIPYTPVSFVDTKSRILGVRINAGKSKIEIET